MPLLPPLPSTQPPTQEVEQTIACVICGKVVPIWQGINAIITVGVPGIKQGRPFQCEHEEHFACSPEHWLQMAHACIDEHVHQMLLMIHEAASPQEHTAVPAPAPAPDLATAPQAVPQPAPAPTSISVGDMFAHLLKELQ